jgi:hypothetical protein
MSPLIIEATRATPRIQFDPARHVLELVGESYPEHAAKFYGPVFEWLESYLAEPSATALAVNLKLIYFNSSTSKILLNLFDRLDQVAAAGRAVTIQWRFDRENEVAQECGEEFQDEVSHAVFELVPLP